MSEPITEPSPSDLRLSLFVYAHGSMRLISVADWFFARPGPAAPSQPPQQPAPSAVTASEIGPLTSPPAGRRQSSRGGGEPSGVLATPLADGQTSQCTVPPLYTPCI
jgi:hypothetical protein